MTASLPLMGAVLPVLLDGVDEGLHANLVRAVVLLQVVYVELDCVAFADIANGEEVPLAVGERIVVELQEEVVFALTDSLCLPQVP